MKWEVSTSLLRYSLQEEKLLADYLLECSKMHYGLTKVSAMKLASDYAIVNGRKVPESWHKNKSTGKDWFRGYLKRNPQLSLRTPEATSLSRATSFNRKNVKDFFDNLKEVEKNFILRHRIYRLIHVAR
jgi:hypothetical protein